MGSSEVAEPSGTLSWPPWARTAGAKRRKRAGNTPPGEVRVDIAIVKIVEGGGEEDDKRRRAEEEEGRGREKKRIITMGMTAANERGQRRERVLMRIL